MSDGSRFKAIKGATWVRIGDILGIDTILFCSELADYDICKASECCIAVPNSCVFPCTYAEYLCTQKLRANDVKEGDLLLFPSCLLHRSPKNKSKNTLCYVIKKLVCKAKKGRHFGKNFAHWVIKS